MINPPEPGFHVILFYLRMHLHISLPEWFVPQRPLRLLCLLCFGLLMVTVRNARSQPRLSIDGATAMNIGTLYEGQTTVRKLAMANGGNSTLHISRLWTSCGCTAAALSSTDISPGTGETLSVSFDTKDLQGNFKREVHIASNDPRTPQLDLSFAGTIVPVVLVTPRYVSFDRMSLNHPRHTIVRITNTIRDTIRIRSYSTPEPQMSLSLDAKIIPPDSSAQLGVDVLPVNKGKLLGQIEMVTDSKLKPVIKISYIGTVR